MEAIEGSSEQVLNEKKEPETFTKVKVKEESTEFLISK